MTNNTAEKSHTHAPRSLKERQRAERESLILQAACDLLVEKGYHEMSIDEIAARVGIAKGTVYLHFPGKEDLVAALVEQHIVESMALVGQVISETTTVRARLERLLHHAYTGIHKDRQLLPELTNLIGLTKGLIEKRPALQARIAETTAQIVTLFEQGQRTGELDPSVPASIMAATFIGLLSLQGYEHLLTTGEVSPEQLVTSVSRILFDGWSKSPTNAS